MAPAQDRIKEIINFDVQAAENPSKNTTRKLRPASSTQSQKRLIRKNQNEFFAQTSNQLIKQNKDELISLTKLFRGESYQ